MKISGYKDTYYEFSKLASAGARQLSFAGIAIVWVFRAEGGLLPQAFLLPTALFVFALMSDLLQYVSATLIWWIMFRYYEPRRSPDVDIKHSPILVYPMTVFFLSKLGCVIAGYVVLAVEVGNRLFAS